MDERFTFFWDGPFSQWHESEFVVDELNYGTAEQFMMAAKARLFGDDVILSAIMASPFPAEQKALGRQVANFDQVVWEADARAIVYRGNYAKFTQNPPLLDTLFATAGTTLVEASPFDRIWGIGLLASDPRAQHRVSWRGKNWLGEVLTQLRDDLLDVRSSGL